MGENLNNMVYIDELREKLGVSPKKCLYKIIEGEAIIFKVRDNELYSA